MCCVFTECYRTGILCHGHIVFISSGSYICHFVRTALALNSVRAFAPRLLLCIIHRKINVLEGHHLMEYGLSGIQVDHQSFAYCMMSIMLLSNNPNDKFCHCIKDITM